MKKFMIRDFWKQHRSFKPRFNHSVSGIGNGQKQRKQSPKITSKSKSSLVKFNKIKYSKELASIKKQILSFLSHLEWKRLASPLIELVLPSLITKRTLLEVGNFRSFNNVHVKNELPSHVKCCERPEPFHFGEKIGLDCNVGNPFDISQKKEKDKTLSPQNIHKKPSLLNEYIPFKKVIDSTIQMLIPNINYDEKLRQIGDFRHSDDSFSIPSHCKPLLMEKSTSQVKEHVASLPLIGVEPNLPPKTNANRKDILSRGQEVGQKDTYSPESCELQKVPAKEKYPLHSKEIKKGTNRKHVKKISPKKRSQILINGKDINKGVAVKEALNRANNKANPEKKDSLTKVKEMSKRKGKQYFPRRNQDLNEELVPVEHLEETPGLVKAEKSVLNKTWSTAKSEEPSNKATNQTAVGTRLEFQTLPKNKSLQRSSPSNDFKLASFHRQPLVQNNLSGIAGLSKPKANTPYTAVNPSYDSMRSEDKTNKSCCESKYIIREENDWMQSTRNMLKKLQQSEYHLGKSNTQITMDSTQNKSVVLKKEYFQKFEKGNKSKNKSPKDEKKEVIIKSNFVAFDTSGKSGQLVIKEQSLALGKGIRNSLVSFEHVLKEEEASLRSFNQNNEKCHTNKQKDTNNKYNGSALKPWRQQNENLDVNVQKSTNKSIPDDIGRKADTLTLTKSTGQNTLKDNSGILNTALENGLNNSFGKTCTDKKHLFEEHEIVNNDRKVGSLKEKTSLDQKALHRTENKLVEKEIHLESGINDENNHTFNSFDEIKYSSNVKGVLDRRIIEKNTENDNFSVHKLNHDTVPGKNKLKCVKTTNENNGSENVTCNEKLDKCKTVSLNPGTHPIETDLKIFKEKLPLNNLEVSEIKHKQQPQYDTSTLKIIKYASETKTNSLLPIHNLKLPDPTLVKEVKLNMTTNKFNLADSKNTKLNLETRNPHEKYNKYENVLRKTVSSISYSTNKVSKGKTPPTTVSTSVSAKGQRYNKDRAKYNTVVSNNKLKVYPKSINKDNPEIKSNPHIKENIPLMSKKTRHKVSKKAQRENHSRSNQLNDTKAKNAVHQGNDKNGGSKISSKSNIECSEQARGEMKPLKSSSFNSVKTDTIASLNKTYEPASKTSNDKITKADLKLSGIKEPKKHTVKIEKQDLVVKALKGTKQENTAENYLNGDTKNILPKNKILKHKSEVNLSHLEYANLNSKNEALNARSHTKLNAPIDTPTVGRLSVNVIHTTNIVNTESEAKMGDKILKPAQYVPVETAKPLTTKKESITNNNADSKKIKADRKFENKHRKEEKSNLKVNKISHPLTLSKSAGSGENAKVDKSIGLLSEKKKLKSKLKRLLKGLSITGQQQKYIQSRNNSQENVKKDTNGLKTAKHESPDTQFLAKSKDGILFSKSSEGNIAVKTEVKASMSYKNNNMEIKCSTKDVLGSSNIIEDNKGGMRTHHEDKGFKMNQMPKSVLKMYQTPLEDSKATTETNNHVTSKVKQEVRYLAKVAHAPQISKIITKQPTSKVVDKSHRYNNRKTTIK